MNILKMIILGAVASALSCSADARYLNKGKKLFAEYNGNYVLVASKKNFMLYVIGREGIAARYPMAYGLNPDKKKKMYQDDDRTPEGIYHINEILSMDAPRHTDSYKKLYKMNKVYFRAKDGHHKFGLPHVDLGDNAYGPRFYRISYPNEDDTKRYNKALLKGTLPLINGRPPGIGFGIAIHGNNDPGSIGHLATSGCIRMYNDDIIELEQYIQIGTPIHIIPD